MELCGGTVNTKQSELHCVCVCAGMARRIIVRDMGNSVDRIEMSGFTTLEAAKDECRLPDRLQLPCDSDRMKDICFTAAQPSPDCSCSDCIQSGSMRGIDDQSFELLVWRVD